VVVADQVDASLRARDDARSGMYVAMLVGTVLAAVIGALAAGPATRRIDRLVQRIRLAAVHVDEDSDARVGRIGARDLDAAAASVDQLLDELRASDAARRRLFADAAHELRTPVTSIRTNAQLLTRDASIVGEQRDIAERIARQSAVVGQLVSGLVDHAGALGWGARIEPDVRLRDVIESAARVHGEHAPDAAIALDLDDSVANADPELLRRALGNLLDNATRHGAREIGVTLRDGVIAIADDGPGFADDIADDAFRPFARGDDAGSGLGLAFVEHVARAHGGAARIASARPAIVELHLPIGQSDDSQEAPRIPSDDARTGNRTSGHAQRSEEVEDE
jgi:two-component system sensor histidine kinase MprB